MRYRQILSVFVFGLAAPSVLLGGRELSHPAAWVRGPLGLDALAGLSVPICPGVSGRPAKAATDSVLPGELESLQGPQNYSRETLQLAAGSSFQPSVVETEADDRRRLELEFERSVSEFDEKLLRERETASDSSTARSSRAAGASASGGNGGTESANGRQGMQGRTGEAAEGEAGSTGRSAEGEIDAEVAGSGSGARNQGGSAGGKNRHGLPAGQGPPGIPDGSDDDVVARQIREAAESETDPALRERLWQEYRDYKNSTR